MTAPRHSIFISYRRVDSVYAVDQLDERLKLAFGADTVFRDASSIVRGAVFPQSIRDALGVARVALLVIGPGWLRATVDPPPARTRRRGSHHQPNPQSGRTIKNGSSPQSATSSSPIASCSTQNLKRPALGVAVQ